MCSLNMGMTAIYNNNKIPNTVFELRCKCVWCWTVYLPPPTVVLWYVVHGYQGRFLHLKILITHRIKLGID